MSNFGSVTVSAESARRFDNALKAGMRWHEGNLAGTVKNGARDLLMAKGGLLQSTPMARRKGGNRPSGNWGRGFARSGWGTAMVALGKAPRAFYFLPSGNRPLNWPKHGDAQLKLSGPNPSVSMTNMIPYIEEVPGASAIADIAFQNVANELEKRNDRHMGRYRLALIRAGKL